MKNENESLVFARWRRGGEGEGRGGSTTWACLQRQRIPRFWPRQFSNKSRGSFQNFRIFDTVALSSSRKEREIPLVPLFYSPLMANCYELFVYPKRQSIKVVSTISTLLLSFCKNIRIINISNIGILNFQIFIKSLE